MTKFIWSKLVSGSSVALNIECIEAITKDGAETLVSMKDTHDGSYFRLAVKFDEIQQRLTTAGY